MNPDESNGSIGEISKEDVTDKCLWTSSNSNIATVDSKGKVTGIAEGTATITAKYDIENGIYPRTNKTYEITVKSKGKNITMMIIGIFSLILISIIIYKNYKIKNI